MRVPSSHAIDAAKVACDRAPELEVQPALFSEHLESCAARAQVELEVLCLDDLLVAYAASLGRSAALAEIQRRLSAIRPELARVGSSADFAREAEQATLMKLVAVEGERAKILDYSGKGPLSAWLRAVAVGTALNLKRGRCNEEADEVSDDLAIADANPEMKYLKLRCGDALRLALKESLAKLSPRDRNVLRLRFLDGLSIDEIGDYYRVHRATIARWIGAFTEQVLADTRRNLSETLDVDTLELESIIRDGRSVLEQSLRGIFAEASLQAPDRAAKDGS